MSNVVYDKIKIFSNLSVEDIVISVFTDAHYLQSICKFCRQLILYPSLAHCKNICFRCKHKILI